MDLKRKILLCCDLDRTLLPNGEQQESCYARPLFSELVKVSGLTLAYVSGRDLALMQDAIIRYSLPLPGYAVGDVGSSIYSVANERWEPMHEWREYIAPDWGKYGPAELQTWCCDIDGLTLQEASKQNDFKLSYYTLPELEREKLLKQIDARMREHGVRASIVWSLDERAQVGLLDILPLRATKLDAVRFLLQQTETPETGLLFAGDSGNDMPVLTSGLQAVLVANASADVREEAATLLQDKGPENLLYTASGSFLGMNGNYAAGVLEGLAHFFPETKVCMQQAMARIKEIQGRQ